MHSVLDMDHKGSGQTMMLAMQSRPNNGEDGAVVKKEFIEYGGMMIAVRGKYATQIKDISDPADILIKPDNRYTTIEDNGLPRLNEVISQGQCNIGKLSGSRDNSEKMNYGDISIVHDVHITTKNQQRHVIVTFISVRNQNEGDKISARNSQKCTIAEITREYNLPRNVSAGWSPDIYVNSHCIPGRVTPSYLYMMNIGTLACRLGKILPGEPGAWSELIARHGRLDTSYRLTNRLFDHIDYPINCGPVYMQILKHQVAYKKMSRGFGSSNPRTRQPRRGRVFSGGLKFGEMEVDGVCNTGAYNLSKERMSHMSDKITLVLCRVCGQNADFDSSGVLPCVNCKGKDMVSLDTTYVSQLFINILAGAQLKLTRKLDVQDHPSNNAYMSYTNGSRDPNDENYLLSYLKNYESTSIGEGMGSGTRGISRSQDTGDASQSLSHQESLLFSDDDTEDKEEEEEEDEDQDQDQDEDMIEEDEEMENSIEDNYYMSDDDRDDNRDDSH